jgi:hypothetical protein
LASLPSGSSIPGALAGALALAASTLPPDSTVYYGNELPAYSAPLTFQITEISGDQKVAELGPQYRREEVFALICTLVYYSGGAPDFPTQLDTLMANFVLLSLAIGNNPTLGGAVRFAEVGNFHITSEIDRNGQGASTLDFSIRCQQRVTSLT